MQVLVHGGAGSTPPEPALRQRVLDRAAARGTEAETDTNTDTPLASVVAAIRVLEADPRFNAGVGSAVQSDGRIRTDAGVMTPTETGAACSMPGVEAAVKVARAVATETPHVLVAGTQAVGLAETAGVATDRDLWTDRREEQWSDYNPPAAVDDQLAWVRETFGGTDTVGAVATDGEGLAAATSTGGRWCALAGRVGDVPQVGAGFYATDTTAVSTTGAGEQIAEFGLARAVAERVESGTPPDAAAQQTLARFEAATDAVAGVIVTATTGGCGTASNADAMQTARAGHVSA